MSFLWWQRQHVIAALLEYSQKFRRQKLVETHMEIKGVSAGMI